MRRSRSEHFAAKKRSTKGLPDADAFEAAPPVEAEADPIPAPVTQMLSVPPAAVPVAPPVETAALIGRCILIGLGVAVALFVVMMVV